MLLTKGLAFPALYDTVTGACRPLVSSSHLSGSMSESETAQSQMVSRRLQITEQDIAKASSQRNTLANAIKAASKGKLRTPTGVGHDQSVATSSLCEVWFQNLIEVVKFLAGVLVGLLVSLLVSLLYQ